MNLTYTCNERIGNVKNKNNSPVHTRFVSKTSNIKNLSENIRSDVETPEVATLLLTIEVTQFNIPNPENGDS